MSLNKEGNIQMSLSSAQPRQQHRGNVKMVCIEKLEFFTVFSQLELAK